MNIYTSNSLTLKVDGYSKVDAFNQLIWKKAKPLPNMSELRSKGIFMSKVEF